MYAWRKMSDAERESVIKSRRQLKRPWHHPPHFIEGAETRFLLTAACYEHKSIVGQSVERLSAFETELCRTINDHCQELHAWCVLPNHYHLLVDTKTIAKLLHALGRLHGRTAYAWNQADAARGRKVWYRVIERFMRSERHFWATMNYIHHNPVKHGYVKKWQDWPFGSAGQFIETFGREYAHRIWQEYPIKHFGKTWDPTVPNNADRLKPSLLRGPR